ncbi:MAG: MATE family efflux transporter, partial [Clostridia bacterium]
YFLFTGLSFPFLAIYNSCAALYRSMGNSHVSLLASALMNVINIGGNAILIYVLGMGAAGAAIATLVSRAIAAMLMLMLIRNHRNPIYLEQLHHVKFNSQMVRSILRIGIPSGMENGIFHFGKLIVQTLTASLGTSAIAANAIVNSISSILVVPGSAVGLSMITVVGQCVGAGDYRQAVQYTKKLMLLAYGCLLLLNLPLLLIYRPLIGLFHLSTEASNLAIQILPLLTITHIIFWPMAFTFPNALRAAGDARFTMIVSIISMWTLRVGMSYVLVLVFKLGLPGIWYAMYFDWILRIICFVIRFSGNRWKNKKVIL